MKNTQYILMAIAKSAGVACAMAMGTALLMAWANGAGTGSLLL